MNNVISNKEALNEYLNGMFTDNGQEVMKGYLSTLIKLYQSKLEYPYEMGVILGIPTYQYSRTITSQDELLGRIKSLMQVLAISEVMLKKEDDD